MILAMSFMEYFRGRFAAYAVSAREPWVLHEHEDRWPAQAGALVGSGALIFVDPTAVNLWSNAVCSDGGR